MRIVQLSTNMARGGAETLVAQLSIRLRQRGHDVHVVSLIEPTAFGEELAAAGVPLYAPGLHRVASLLRRLRPQVLHCHMFHANVVGRLLRLAMPFPCVISTLHSVAETGRHSRSIGARDLVYRLTDRLADATVCVSEAVAARHVEARALRHPVVIPNGIDTDRFAPDHSLRERTRRTLGLGEDEFVWIAVGRLMWKKNYRALLDAYRECGCGVLLIAGSGPDEDELRNAAGPNIRFLGLREDIHALLNAADAFVMTSVIEGLPLALLEAAATGLPCVATPAGGVQEVGVGLVSGNVAPLIRQVCTMGPDARRALGSAARRRVLDRYSLSVVVSQWEALYSSM